MATPESESGFRAGGLWGLRNPVICLLLQYKNTFYAGQRRHWNWLGLFAELVHCLSGRSNCTVAVKCTTQAAMMSSNACSMPDENCTLLMKARPERWHMLSHACATRDTAGCGSQTLVGCEVMPNGLHQMLHVHLDLQA